MPYSRLTIRISSRLHRSLRSRAKARGQSESLLVCSLLEREFAQEMRSSRKRTLYDALLESGLIGCAPGGLPDLSTNKKYMEGFGEWDSDAYRQKVKRSRRQK